MCVFGGEGGRRDVYWSGGEEEEREESVMRERDEGVGLWS